MNDDLFDVTPEQPIFIGGDGNEPPFGSREWLLLTRDRFRSEMNSLRPRHTYVRKLFNEMRESGAWGLINKPKTNKPFATFDEFCRSHIVGLRQSEEEIEGFLTELQQMAQPVEQGGVAPLPKHGGDHKSEQAKADQDDNIILKQQGTSAAYIVAKLKRDAPEFAERLAAGEFRSARAAGIAAGIVTPDAPLTLLRRAWKRASADERDAFREEINLIHTPCVSL